MQPGYNSEDLRDHAGVAVIIEDSKGRILMQDHVKYGFWTIPVGKSKPGQSPIECAKEEVFEECNLHIDELEELAHKTFKYERQGKMVTVDVYIFKPHKVKGVMMNKEPEKHRTQQFMELEDIKKIPYLSDNTILYLECIGFQRPARM